METSPRSESIRILEEWTWFGGVMPLSEHEQRLLDQIERALSAEDPKFASTVRSSDLKSHHLRRLRSAAIFLIIGLGLLLTGTVASFWPLGVAGFVVMVFAGMRAASVAKALSGRVSSVRPAAPTKGSFAQRAEDRLRRRLDGDDL